MRFTRYTKYVPGLADEINLQGLLDRLSDFLLQSGFAGGKDPYWGDFDETPGSERTIEGLKDAILRALMESGELTPEMVRLLRGESTGDEQRDAELSRDLAKLLDDIVRRLMNEGYLSAEQPPARRGPRRDHFFSSSRTTIASSSSRS